MNQNKVCPVCNTDLNENLSKLVCDKPNDHHYTLDGGESWLIKDGFIIALRHNKPTTILKRNLNSWVEVFCGETNLSIDKIIDFAKNLDLLK